MLIFCMFKVTLMCLLFCAVHLNLFGIDMKIAVGLLETSEFCFLNVISFNDIFLSFLGLNSFNLICRDREQTQIARGSV